MEKKKASKRICLCLLVLAILLVLTTGCEKKDYSNGVLEGYSYSETEEETNYVKILTSKNEVVLIQLLPDTAPITVQNFKDLVKEKFYDNLTFHRVIENFMIQTGDPLGNGTGGSEKKIKGEFASNGVENNLKHKTGVVSMARSSDYNSASSQFFICVSDNVSYLDGEYAAFGRVIAGLDAVERISEVSTDSSDKPVKPEKMISVRFVNVTKEES